MKGLWQDRALRLKKCKPYILVFCLLFALVQLLGSTLAWFTAADGRVNAMESPPNKQFFIHGVDVFSPNKDGDLWHKRVGAENPSEKPGFVRLLVSAVVEIPSAVAGVPPTLLPASIGASGSGALVIMNDFNGTDWIDATDPAAGGDGYFYYKHILEPGESTDDGFSLGSGKNLFNEVMLASPLPPGYEYARLVIEVKCEAVGIKPSTVYVDSWWGGSPPASGILLAVYTALQTALGL
ncbi:MAG: hypothetical protein FWE98_03960 [Oscillospiraceae bacterium]|nr:hypothetical protein [Oscillospiraceae bacterium]